MVNYKEYFSDKANDITKVIDKGVTITSEIPTDKSITNYTVEGSITPLPITSKKWTKSLAILGGASAITYTIIKKRGFKKGAILTAISVIALGGAGMVVDSLK